MSDNKKILWAEGVVLSQQHFQWIDAEIRKKFHQSLNINSPHQWGLKELIIDKQQLLLNVFSIKAMDIIFPSGHQLTFTELNSESLSVALTETVHDIYLEWPQTNMVFNLNGYPKHKKEHCSWVVEYEEKTDEYDENKKRELIFIHVNVSLVLDKPKYPKNAIKIATVKQEKQSYQLVSDYIPPILSIGVTSSCLDLIDKISIELRNIIDAFKLFNEDHCQKDDVIFAQKASIQLLSIMKQALIHTKVHPYVLYQSIEAYCIELAIINKNWLATCFTYEHMDIASSYGFILEAFSKILNKLKDKKNLLLYMSRASDGAYEASLLEQHLQTKNCILTIQFKTDSYQFNLDKIKISSASVKAEVIASASPGLDFTVLPTASNGDKIKLELYKTSEHWQMIKKDQSIFFYYMDYHEIERAWISCEGES